MNPADPMNRPHPPPVAVTVSTAMPNDTLTTTTPPTRTWASQAGGTRVTPQVAMSRS